MANYGWQQPGAPIKFKLPSLAPRQCPHILVGMAQTQAYRHELGHSWLCSCGQEFIVSMVRGNKRLVKARPA